MKVTAAVCRAPHSPFLLEELDLDEPRVDEVLVKISSCGVCHTDMAMRDKAYPVPQPIVFGHEAAGFVEKVGANVKGFSAGDPVILSYDSCGTCQPCMQALPSFCENYFSYNFGGSRQDGSTALRKGNEKIHSNFFGQSSFATYSLASPRSLIKLDSTEDMDYFGPLGCGIQTGAGAALNALKIGAGDTFAVFGIGSVALSALMAAKLAGATTIIAVGRSDEKLALAQELGATHTINSKKTDDVVALIKDITKGRGVSHSLDTSGVVSIINQAVECLAILGKAAIVGASAVGSELNLELSRFMNAGKVLMGSIEGNTSSQVFIPKLIDLYRKGLFPIDKITSFYSFEDINKAVEDSENGRIIKAVLKM